MRVRRITKLYNITVKKESFYSADSLEIALLAILAPAVRCEWNLSHYHEAMLTTVRIIDYIA